jgi:hypothetical protein
MNKVSDRFSCCHSPLPPLRAQTDTHTHTYTHTRAHKHTHTHTHTHSARHFATVRVLPETHSDSDLNLDYCLWFSPTSFPAPLSWGRQMGLPSNRPSPIWVNLLPLLLPGVVPQPTERLTTQERLGPTRHRATVRKTQPPAERRETAATECLVDGPVPRERNSFLIQRPGCQRFPTLLPLSGFYQHITLHPTTNAPMSSPSPPALS